MGPVYQPAEDSLLLARHIERLTQGDVLDMGTGSGIQAVTAALKPEVTRVVAADIDTDALAAARSRAAEHGVALKITFVESDLFSAVHGRFDWILFNPPYLPPEPGLADQTWDGGGDGSETTERLLKEARDHLNEGGSILLVYSSFTPLKEEFGYSWEVLEEMPLFFETLYCALLSPS